MQKCRLKLRLNENGSRRRSANLSSLNPARDIVQRLSATGNQQATTTKFITVHYTVRFSSGNQLHKMKRLATSFLDKTANVGTRRRLTTCQSCKSHVRLTSRQLSATMKTVNLVLGWNFHPHLTPSGNPA